MHEQKMIPWDVIIEILNKHQANNPGHISERINKHVNYEIYEWYYGQDEYEQGLKARLVANQSRQVFEEILLTRWEYIQDPDFEINEFEINESTGECEDELVQMGMSDLTRHIGRAKQLLSKWYAQGAQFEIKSVQGTRWQQFWMTSFYKRKALHCKTAGLVWHDRYKMMLDCNRKNL